MDPRRSVRIAIKRGTGTETKQLLGDHAVQPHDISSGALQTCETTGDDIGDAITVEALDRGDATPRNLVEKTARRNEEAPIINAESPDNMRDKAGSQHSLFSTRNLVTKKHLLQAKAAREQAELDEELIKLEEKRIAARRAVIEATLTENMALLEEENDDMSTGSSVKKWVDQTAAAYDVYPAELVQYNNTEEMSKTLLENVQESPIAELTRTISNAIKAVSTSTPSGDKLLGRLSAKDLPTFSGDPLDWLRFKRAYDTTTQIGQYTEAENVVRLQRSLRGEAWDAVAAHLITATSADTVMKTLELRFGRSELIIHKLIDEMRRTPKLSGMRTELILLATETSNCVAAMEALEHIGYLHSPELVTEIVSKLTEPLVYRWLDHAAQLTKAEPRLPALAKYLMTEAERACQAGVVEIPQKSVKPTFSAPKRSIFLTTQDPDAVDTRVTNAVTEKWTTKAEQLKCAYCDKNDHAVDKCSIFQDIHVNKRWEWVCQKRLCFSCLTSRHRRKYCKIKKKCSVCKGNHHPLLHRDDWSASGAGDKETTANMWSNCEKKVYLKVLPVVVEGPRGSVHTYALLDEGSTVTLVERQIADEVGADGPQIDLNLQGAIGGENLKHSRMISLTLRTPDGRYSIDRVRTIENFTLPVQSLDKTEIIKYQHLQDIPIETFKGQPTLLIGQDNWHLIVSREVREGKKNEPVASRTRLGWVFHGFVTSVTKALTGLTLHLHANNDEDLHELVKKYFQLESIGITRKDRVTKEERRALEILDIKSKRDGDKGETGRLWRSDEDELPNNKKNAELRLRQIERKMDRDTAFAADYIKQVTNMLEKNYAKDVKDPITGSRIWYLPHFGVRNANKPGKLRLVLDAAAETSGVSLNNLLLAGPDLLNSLLGVLMRFREKAVAVTGDIREMFLQVKINKEDRKSQCFLWREMDRKNTSRTYLMSSMIFGAASSPCTATYIIRRNADEFSTTHPRAVAAIKRRHYVDDYLDSVDTEEEMRQLIEDVAMIHKRGGFEIRGWASNRPNVVPQEQELTSVSLFAQEDSIERTLGLHWKPFEDNLGFDLSLRKIDKEVADGLRRPTKREMLKVIMSVFDPLGLLSPLLISAKILMQEVWRSGVQWDEQLGEKMSQVWFRWLTVMKQIKNFAVPRCYGFVSSVALQFHIFVDASEQAYAAVAYLRQDDRITFVAGKSRVAPLKITTIPRLELQSALLGSRLAATVGKELELPFESRFFWTDSKIVWHWIQNDPRQYKPFISHRLAEIDELTNAREWRWLPGRLNAADEATRAIVDNSDVNFSNSRWLMGPEFLKLPEEHRPSDASLVDMETQSCERRQAVNLITKMDRLIAIERFSSWRRLVRSLTMALLFIDRCRHLGKHLTPEYDKRTEALILRQAQRESFPEDLRRLERGENIRPGSKLRQLSPELDNDGLIRIASRLQAAVQIFSDMKRPVILDGQHHVSRLIIIEWKHKQLGHQGYETLLNEICQQYYVLRLRTTARSMIARCVVCRIRRARHNQPMMASLPPARLQHHYRPFTFCGVDLFGPMTVTVGRRQEKRWGVLFTCLSVRAVHIELAASLSTDSTILAVRRMAARRGCPRQMYSDNGTNFRGADRELREAAQEVLDMSERGIEWRYNPPDAPHMGGAWERLVRSIKTALAVTLRCRTPKEEVLLTLLAEAENIINSRPLTHVSLDPDEQEALTPNHFLLGSSNTLLRPGEFTDDDLHLRKQWRMAQRLADNFWSRWVREYLPCLQTRKKWNLDDGHKLCIGDLVLIADPASPRNTWARGKVVATTPGRDGRVRIADVATRSGTLRRPASKLIVLLRVNEDHTTADIGCHHE